MALPLIITFPPTGDGCPLWPRWKRSYKFVIVKCQLSTVQAAPAGSQNNYLLFLYGCLKATVDCSRCLVWALNYSAWLLAADLYLKAREFNGCQVPSQFALSLMSWLVYRKTNIRNAYDMNSENLSTHHDF